ncbi:MAG: murein biosynthesis integral membrane protein MurJ [Holosporaceae bacterium]|jgi:putative peptidoglycan lipid II flippase|nr:murein biosynthesis integral membrane protein MurJ [Holosporaceae bacterium]
MSLIKNVVTVGGWTLLYRVSSFIRDIAQSTILGAGIFADVFSLSFKLANILRKLFAEGAFNASFLPIFASTLKDKGPKEAQKIASQIFTWLVIMVTCFMIVFLICFRNIMHVYAAGIEPSSDKFNHLVAIGRISSPYIATSFLAALFGGILNTVNRFAMPAAIQLTLNIFIVIALFIGALSFPSVAYTMAWATFLSGVIQVAVLWLSVGYCNFSIGFNFSRVGDEVKIFFKKLVSGAIGSGVWQLNVIIDFMILSFLPTGAVSYFFYTDHVNQFPLGILGIAFSTALLPPLTKAIHAKNSVVAQKQMDLGLLFAFMFTFPAAVILMSLNHPMTGAIYGHGKFTIEQVTAAAPALAAFALGLPAYMATKVFSTVFFAHKNTKIPLNGGIVSLVTNLLFIVLLMPYMKHTGIALATTLSSWCNGIYLVFKLKELGTMGIDRNVITECLKQLLISAIMLASILAMNIYADSYYTNGGIERNIALAIVCGISITVFVIAGKMLNVFSFLKEIKSMQTHE